MTSSSETRPSRPTNAPMTFDAVYAAYARDVARHAVRLVGPTEAPDLTQRVWLKVARHLGTYNGTAKMRTWLYVITRHVAASLRRSAEDRATRALLPLEHAARVVCDRPTPETLAARHEAQARVQAAVRTLRADHQAVLLAAMAGLSLLETAQTLGLQLGTVKSRLHRARTALALRISNPQRPIANGQPPDPDRPRRGRRERPSVYGHVITCPHVPKASP
jgi:RNA polymerase sigma factor (sigma-70 family)